MESSSGGPFQCLLHSPPKLGESTKQFNDNIKLCFYSDRVIFLNFITDLLMEKVNVTNQAYQRVYPFREETCPKMQYIRQYI